MSDAFKYIISLLETPLFPTTPLSYAPLYINISISITVYAVASRTYAFYSFNMIMYDAILSFGSAAIVYGVIAKLEKPIR